MAMYHMRRHDREITDGTELDDILRRGRFATIALCRGEEPYVVTLSYGYDAAGKCLYFHSGKEGLKMDFLRANPRVCATVVEDGGYIRGECGHAYRSAVLCGRMAEVEDTGGKKYGLGVIFRQLEDDPEGMRAKMLQNEKAYQGIAVLRLDIEAISGKKGR